MRCLLTLICGFPSDSMYTFHNPNCDPSHLKPPGKYLIMKHLSEWLQGPRRNKHCTRCWRHTSTCKHLGVRVLDGTIAGGWKEMMFTSWCLRILWQQPLKIPYPSTLYGARSFCPSNIFFKHQLWTKLCAGNCRRMTHGWTWSWPSVKFRNTNQITFL